jgi:hypothetical protein
VAALSSSSQLPEALYEKNSRMMFESLVGDTAFTHPLR